MTENTEICPCGSGAAFAACCEPIIKGTRESETAEELMRARYSAFVTHAIDFIVSSTHTRTRKEIDLSFIREWSETSTWRGLEILETKQVNDNKALCLSKRSSRKVTKTNVTARGACSNGSTGNGAS